MVRTWLDQADADRLDRVAASRGIDAATVIANALYPHIDAGSDESVWTVVLSAEEEQWLRQEIAELCSDDVDVDIDDEIFKWLRGYIGDGVRRSKEIITE
jgi:hypothetical protein